MVAAVGSGGVVAVGVVIVATIIVVEAERLGGENRGSSCSRW